MAAAPVTDGAVQGGEVVDCDAGAQTSAEVPRWVDREA
ncbi:hypothetical protein CH72_4437 [Burkholderia ambifaria AMMD]|nr:hypothetical protein CH72_4437 [Burkholderia ambifaria AMMD]